MATIGSGFLPTFQPLKIREELDSVGIELWTAETSGNCGPVLPRIKGVLDKLHPVLEEGTPYLHERARFLCYKARYTILIFQEKQKAKALTVAANVTTMSTSCSSSTTVVSKQSVPEESTRSSKQVPTIPMSRPSLGFPSSSAVFAGIPQTSSFLSVGERVSSSTGPVFSEEIPASVRNVGLPSIAIAPDVFEGNAHDDIDTVIDTAVTLQSTVIRMGELYRNGRLNKVRISMQEFDDLQRQLRNAIAISPDIEQRRRCVACLAELETTYQDFIQQLEQICEHGSSSDLKKITDLKGIVETLPKNTGRRESLLKRLDEKARTPEPDRPTYQFYLFCSDIEKPLRYSQLKENVMRYFGGKLPPYIRLDDRNLAVHLYLSKSELYRLEPKDGITPLRSLPGGTDSLFGITCLLYHPALRTEAARVVHTAPINMVQGTSANDYADDIDAIFQQVVALDETVARMEELFASPADPKTGAVKLNVDRLSYANFQQLSHDLRQATSKTTHNDQRVNCYSFIAQLQSLERHFLEQLETLSDRVASSEKRSGLLSIVQSLPDSIHNKQLMLQKLTGKDAIDPSKVLYITMQLGTTAEWAIQYRTIKENAARYFDGVIPDYLQFDDRNQTVRFRIRRSKLLDFPSKHGIQPLALIYSPINSNAASLFGVNCIVAPTYSYYRHHNEYPERLIRMMERLAPQSLEELEAVVRSLKMLGGNVPEHGYIEAIQACPNTTLAQSILGKHHLFMRLKSYYFANDESPTCLAQIQTLLKRYEIPKAEFLGAMITAMPPVRRIYFEFGNPFYSPITEALLDCPVDMLQGMAERSNHCHRAGEGELMTELVSNVRGLAHGCRTDMGGFRNFINIMLEGSLRPEMNYGALGPADFTMPNICSGPHGPFYLMLESQTKISAFLVPFDSDKRLAIDFINIAHRKGMITPAERENLLSKLFTIPEYIRASKRTEAEDLKKVQSDSIHRPAATLLPSAPATTPSRVTVAASQSVNNSSSNNTHHQGASVTSLGMSSSSVGFVGVRSPVSIHSGSIPLVSTTPQGCTLGSRSSPPMPLTNASVSSSTSSMGTIRPTMPTAVATRTVSAKDYSHEDAIDELQFSVISLVDTIHRIPELYRKGKLDSRRVATEDFAKLKAVLDKTTRTHRNPNVQDIAYSFSSSIPSMYDAFCTQLEKLCSEGLFNADQATSEDIGRIQGLISVIRTLAESDRKTSLLQVAEKALINLQRIMAMPRSMTSTTSSTHIPAQPKADSAVAVAKPSKYDHQIMLNLGRGSSAEGIANKGMTKGLASTVIDLKDPQADTSSLARLTNMSRVYIIGHCNKDRGYIFSDSGIRYNFEQFADLLAKNAPQLIGSPHGKRIKISVYACFGGATGENSFCANLSKALAARGIHAEVFGRTGPVRRYDPSEGVFRKKIPAPFQKLRFVTTGSHTTISEA